MKNSIFTFTKFTLLITFILCVSLAKANNVESRIAVVNNTESFKIYLSNFPANSLIIVSDSENNLISVVTSNNVGAAVINLNKQITKSITAKTIEGNHSASFSIENVKKEESKIYSNNLVS